MGMLDKEYVVFNGMKEQLEAEHHLEWVVVHDDEFVGIFKTFEDAAEVAIRRFGRGPYLIKRIGAPPPTLPPSVQYGLMHANN